MNGATENVNTFIAKVSTFSMQGQGWKQNKNMRAEGDMSVSLHEQRHIIVYLWYGLAFIVNKKKQKQDLQAGKSWLQNSNSKQQKTKRNEDVNREIWIWIYFPGSG